MILELELISPLIKHEDVPGLQKLSVSVRKKVSRRFFIERYGNAVDKLQIFPTINTREEYDKGKSPNHRMCSWSIGWVTIFMRMSIDYEEFCNAPAEEKVYQTAKTALDAIKYIKKTARKKLDCNRLIRDVFSAYDKYIQEKLLAEGYKIPEL